MHRPTVNVKLYPQKTIKEGVNAGRHNYKLWVTFKVGKDFKQRMYKTRFYATAEEDLKINGKDKPRDRDLQAIRMGLKSLETEVNDLIDQKKISTQDKFELEWLEGVNTQTVSGQFEVKVKELLAAKPKPKVSSAENYKTALRSFLEFSHPELTFNEISKDWLEDYEDWYTNAQKDDAGNVIKPGQSLTTVGINTRALRHIFKRAIKAEIISDKLYPFGLDGGYVIPEGGDEVKQFLEKEEKDAFMNFRFENDDRANWLHDLAIFSYYANGINFSDICRLKKGQIQADHILVRREKTKGRKKKIRRIVVIIHPKMKEIINRWGYDRTSIVPDEYVFPILNKSMDEVEIFKAIRKVVKETNRVLKRVATALLLPIVPTTYTLRHTFSATFLRLGGSTEELQDALGHGDIKTTEVYKHGFTLENKKKFSEGL
jgi:integrase/recombinase XerD